MKLSNETYDILKYIAQIVLPAVATFYTTLGRIWGLPYVNEISATLIAFDTLLGSLLMISSFNYEEIEEDIEDE